MVSCKAAAAAADEEDKMPTRARPRVAENQKKNHDVAAAMLKRLRVAVAMRQQHCPVAAHQKTHHVVAAAKSDRRRVVV